MRQKHETIDIDAEKNRQEQMLDDIIATVDQINERGAKTLERLDQQGETLDQALHNAKSITANVTTGKKIMDRFERNCCCQFFEYLFFPICYPDNPSDVNETHRILSYKKQQQKAGTSSNADHSSSAVPSSSSSSSAGSDDKLDILSRKLKFSSSIFSTVNQTLDEHRGKLNELEPIVDKNQRDMHQESKRIQRNL